MSVGFATTLRSARAQAIVDALDAGVGSTGKIEIYGGGSGRPATGAAITDQTLIGTLLLSKPCAVVTDGVLVFESVTQTSPLLVANTIEWARFYDTDDNFVCDMGCGLSAAELIFVELNTQIGGVIKILSGSITEGNL